MAGGKSKKAGSRRMIECRKCKMWVDLQSCKDLTEMSQSWVFLERWSPPFARRGDKALPEIHLLDQGHLSPHGSMLVNHEARQHVREMYVDENEFDIDTDH
ncbi:hypothetical protein FHG87_015409 [Trinorchestia longiramus]|nr:hypothetical protein FHG87_015409 [Trinorchestia longiramus]